MSIACSISHFTVSKNIVLLFPLCIFLLVYCRTLGCVMFPGLRHCFFWGWRLVLFLVLVVWYQDVYSLWPSISYPPPSSDSSLEGDSRIEWFFSFSGCAGRFVHAAPLVAVFYLPIGCFTTGAYWGFRFWFNSSVFDPVRVLGSFPLSLSLLLVLWRLCYPGSTNILSLVLWYRLISLQVPSFLLFESSFPSHFHWRPLPVYRLLLVPLGLLDSLSFLDSLPLSVIILSFPLNPLEPDLTLILSRNLFLTFSILFDLKIQHLSLPQKCMSGVT